MQRSQKIFLSILVGIVLLGAITTVHYVRKANKFDTPSDIEVALKGTTDRPTVFTTAEGEMVDSITAPASAQVIYTWASWSPFTKEDFALLDQFAQDYPKIQFIALNRAESIQTAQRYLATIPTPEHIKVIIDTNDTIYNAIGGYDVPETVVYGEQGNLLLQARGRINVNLLLTTLQQIASQIPAIITE